jgi:hypothetical protein
LRQLNVTSENLEAIEDTVLAFPNTDNASCVALVRETVKDVDVKMRYCIHKIKF